MLLTFSSSNFIFLFAAAGFFSLVLCQTINFNLSFFYCFQFARRFLRTKWCSRSGKWNIIFLAPSTFKLHNSNKWNKIKNQNLFEILKKNSFLVQFSGNKIIHKTFQYLMNIHNGSTFLYCTRIYGVLHINFGSLLLLFMFYDFNNAWDCWGCYMGMFYFLFYMYFFAFISFSGISKYTNRKHLSYYGGYFFINILRKWCSMKGQ